MTGSVVEAVSRELQAAEAMLSPVAALPVASAATVLWYFLRTVHVLWPPSQAPAAP